MDDPTLNYLKGLGCLLAALVASLIAWYTAWRIAKLVWETIT